MNIKFSPKNQYSMKMYWSKNTDKYSVLYDENDQKYYLRIWEDNSWHYPFWAQDGFDTIKDVEDFLNMHKWETATYRSIETDDISEVKCGEWIVCECYVYGMCLRKGNEEK